MGEPGFWDDQERAAKVEAEHARARRKLSSSARSRATSSTSSRSPSWPRRTGDRVRAGGADLKRPGPARPLEEERLFSGRYDSGDALVTVNAGAGGTDAQDWAEMVLRMEMRWAEKRGFDVELLEVSPGEEAGVKSATFLVKGENAYGLYASEKGVHRLVRLSPFDAAHRRQTSFAGVEVSPSSARSTTSRSTTTTCRSTPTAPAGQAASTSTRPTPRCGSRTSRPGSSSSARTSGRSPPTRPRR